ncbi:hypothetical protein C5167_043737 [Papaver somniferum]|uniref:Ribosomal protein L7/L12 C-terminal domain-containing protein n=1 Tax=Papaver somniferum TaxID=3469 RepID=A0A4Y7LAH1_PAPSO|nr:hypothetical protein C5167_043737 [Papaver somniferum]
MVVVRVEEAKKQLEAAGAKLTLKEAIELLEGLPKKLKEGASKLEGRGEDVKPEGDPLAYEPLLPCIMYVL